MAHTTNDYREAMRRAARASRVADLRDGRKQRSVKFADRRKVASKKACRGNWKDVA